MVKGEGNGEKRKRQALNEIKERPKRGGVNKMNEETMAQANYIYTGGYRLKSVGAGNYHLLDYDCPIADISNAHDLHNHFIKSWFEYPSEQSQAVFDALVALSVY